MNSSYDAPWARPIPKAVKWLLIVTVGVWIFLQMLLGELLGLRLTGVLALVPGDVLFEGWIWQLFTYPFLHSLSVTHILLNMLMLWMIGSELEMRWGARRFFAYYLGSAVGAGVLYTLGVWAYSSVRGETAALAVPVVGASGGIFALLLAYGILFGERVLSFFLLFPMKAKYFVLILGVVEVMTLLSVGDGRTGRNPSTPRRPGFRNGRTCNYGSSRPPTEERKGPRCKGSLLQASTGCGQRVSQGAAKVLELIFLRLQ